MNAIRKTVAATLIGLILTSGARAEDGQRVYQNTVTRTVWVVNTDEKSSGSGVVVDCPHKLVLTNEHVVGKSSEVVVFFPTYSDGQLVGDLNYYVQNVRQLRQAGRMTIGRVVMKDPRMDLALVQLDYKPDDVHEIPLASACASPGQQVHLVGNPGASGALWAYSGGKVKAVYRGSDAGIVEYGSADTNGGDSGAPVVNDRGELVAIHRAHNREARISYGVDLCEIRAILKRYHQAQ